MGEDLEARPCIAGGVVSGRSFEGLCPSLRWRPLRGRLLSYGYRGFYRGLGVVVVKYDIIVANLKDSGRVLING